ncbi:MAG: phosphatase PAP2 family protein [Burkholderiales bacterium]|nr:phosphatase PAP2 family protein [Burkholderiales bacterium]
MIEHLKMPSPLAIFGAFYVLVAMVYFYKLIKCGYWSSVIGNIYLLLRQNLKFIIGGILVFVVLLLVADLALTQLCRHFYNHDIYVVFDFINAMGEGWFIGGVVFTSLMIFQILGKFNLAIISKISFMAAVYAGVINTVLKVFISRERPGIGMNQWNFFHFFTTWHWNDLLYASNSMPSGHTTTIFAAVTPFLLYNKTWFSKLLLLLCSLTIMAARVYTINHWLSDVYISLFLGLIIGKALFLSNKHRLKVV